MSDEITYSEEEFKSLLSRSIEKQDRPSLSDVLGDDVEITGWSTPYPSNEYREPYPLDSRQLEDRIDALQKRQMLMMVGVVGAILMASVSGRLVLKLAQGQAQLARNFGDLATALGMDQRPMETDVPMGSGQAVQVPDEQGSTEVERDLHKEDAPLIVSDPLELGHPKEGHIELPNAAGAREPFRREE